MDSPSLTRRNLAIDMLRALTMLLMVTVNDFWTVGGIPHFLEHTKTMEDGMGLSDVVFPMFLFVMGMSIPYAIESRYRRGQGADDTLAHIFLRGFALIVMGVLTVNQEGSVEPLLGYGKLLWRVLMVLGFFLVWNNYPSKFKWTRLLKWIGIALLVFLAVTFRDGKGNLLRSSWWGILGLIGWAYLFCALAYLLCRKKVHLLAFVYLGLIAVNILTTSLRGEAGTIIPHSIISDFARALNLGNASSAIMAMGGVLCTVTSVSLRDRKVSEGKRLLIAGAGVVAAVGLGLLSHIWWITSKNIGTLPWCMYVTGLSIGMYALLSVLEARGLTHWYKAIEPAGTATLTVYMMPYLYYVLWSVLSLSTPEWVSGGIGVVKCLLFAMLCIWSAGLLGKIGIKLKI